jgi:hypothetical protein
MVLFFLLNILYLNILSDNPSSNSEVVENKSQDGSINIKGCKCIKNT